MKDMLKVHDRRGTTPTTRKGQRQYRSFFPLHTEGMFQVPWALEISDNRRSKADTVPYCQAWYCVRQLSCYEFIIFWISACRCKTRSLLFMVRVQHWSYLNSPRTLHAKSSPLFPLRSRGVSNPLTCTSESWFSLGTWVEISVVPQLSQSRSLLFLALRVCPFYPTVNLLWKLKF